MIVTFKRFVQFIVLHQSLPPLNQNTYDDVNQWDQIRRNLATLANFKKSSANFCWVSLVQGKILKLFWQILCRWPNFVCFKWPKYRTVISPSGYTDDDVDYLLTYLGNDLAKDVQKMKSKPQSLSLFAEMGNEAFSSLRVFFFFSICRPLCKSLDHISLLELIPWPLF